MTPRDQRTRAYDGGPLDSQEARQPREVAGAGLLALLAEQLDAGPLACGCGLIACEKCQAYRERLAATVTRGAVACVRVAARCENDFGGWLAGVLATVAAGLGSTAALTVNGPDSWEAKLVEDLVHGTVGHDDSDLPRYAEKSQR